MLDESVLLGKIRKFSIEGNQGQKCSAIVLFHANLNGRLDPISQWDPHAESPEDIASKISLDAHEDAKEGKGDDQSYTVGFFFGPGSRENARQGNFGARHRFSITPPPSFESSGEGPETEPHLSGTNKATGMLATSYAKDLAKLTIPWANNLMQVQQNTIMRLEAQVNELMAERRRNVVLHEKLASQAHKRQLQTRKLIFWEKQKEEVASIFLPMLAPLLASIAGRPMLPSSPTEETKAFEDFAAGLTDEQLAQLQMKLRPNQLPAVFQIVQAVKTKQAVPNVILREFLKSIDEPQMEDFKTVLTGEQHKDLLMIIVSYMQKYKDRQVETQAAYDQESKPAEEEETVLEDDAAFS